MSTKTIKTKGIFSNGVFSETTLKSSDSILVKLFKKYSMEFEEGYYLNSAIAMMLQSAVGGIAAMFILSQMNDTPYGFAQLVIAVAISSLFNAAVLGQIKAKYVFVGLIISVVINVMLIILNI